MRTLPLLQRKLVAIPLALVAGLLVTYAVLGFFVAPRWLERELPRWSEARLGARAQLHDVRFNPFLLALSARDVRITHADGQPLLRADSLAVDLRWSAIFTRSARIDDLRIDGLDVTVKRGADGRIVLPHARRASAQDAPGTVRLPAMRIGAAVLRRGAIHFIDALVQPPVTSAITAIDFELRDIATDTDRDGRMQLSALLPEGGALAWTGRVALQPIVAEGDLRLIDVRPIVLWKHLRTQVPLSAPAGQLDVSAQYRFAYADGAPQLTLRRIDIEGGALTVAEAGAKVPALQVARVRAREGSFDLARRELILPSVALRTGAVGLAVDERGITNWQRMFKRGGGSGASAQAPVAATTTSPGAIVPASAPWQVRIGALTLENIDFDYSDLSRERPLHVHGKSVSGSAALALEFGVQPARVDLRGVALDIADLSVGVVADAQPALRTSTVKLRDGHIDLATREAQFTGVELGPGALRFAVDRNRRLNWSALFARRADAPAAPAPGWRIAFTDLRASNFAAEYHDESRRRAVRAAISALTGRLDLAIAGGTPSPVTLDNLRFTGKSLSVGALAANAKPLVALASVGLERGQMSDRDLRLSGLRLADGALRIERAQDGGIDLAALLQPAGPDRRVARAGGRDGAAVTTAGVKVAARPWRIELPDLRVERVALRYADRGRAEPLLVQSTAVRASANVHLATGTAARADGLSIRASRLEVGGLNPGPRAIVVSEAALERASLRARTLDLGSIELVGGALRLTRMPDGATDLQRLFVDRARPGPSASVAATVREAQQAWHVRSPDLRLRDFNLRVDDRTRATPVRFDAAGTSARMRFDFVAGQRVAVRDLRMHSGPLTLADPSGARITGLHSASLQGGEVDSVARRMAADSIELRDGDLVMERDVDGRLTLLDALAAAPASRAATPTSAPTGTPWKLRVNRLAIEDVRTRYLDHAYAPPLQIDLPLRQAVLTRLDPSAQLPAGLHAEMGVGAAGHASMDGTLSQDLRRLDATLVAEGVDVKALQPVLGQHLALQIQSGTLRARSALRIRREAGAPPDISTDGEVQVSGLSITESATGARFLGWRELTARPVRYSSQSKRLAIGEVMVQGPVAKLEIAPGGGLNLKHILKAANKQPATQQIAPARPPALEVRIDRLRLRHGAVRYADQTLMLPFDVNIDPFDATFTSVSNVPGQSAQVRAEGRIAPFALAKAEGRVDLSSPKRFTDIRAHFLNVEMPKLSPYTITFAGRAIAAGRLWLDLDTHIENGQLLGNNNVTVRNLKLGERVDAPRARDLPLDLAARLLTNEEGVISVQVPLRGDLNKPGFDYHGIIRKAIGNTLTRLATSPFRIVGRLFGMGSARVDRIAFDAGSAELRPPEREKLSLIARALSEQPALHADLQPSVSPEQDLLAMRTERVRRELARRLGLRLQPGEDPGPTAFDQAATQRALTAMSAARAGAGAAQAPAAQASAPGSARAPGGSADAPIGPGSPDLAFYQSLFERLVQMQPLAADALGDLARRRAQAIADYLAEATRVSPERIRIARTNSAPPERDSDLVQSELRLRGR